MVTAFLLRGMRTTSQSEGHGFMLAQLFNGVTFSGSFMILLGILRPPVMEIIGETTVFLLVAGVAGVCYAVRELFRPFYTRY